MNYNYGTDSVTTSSSETFTIQPKKQYIIDIEKVKSIDDVNLKLDAIFDILSKLDLKISEYTMTEKLYKV
jgi:hypothetical protein